jgi:hypothetical protein
MKPLQMHEVKLFDGTSYRGAIVYRDDKILVLEQRYQAQKLRLFNSGIISIRALKQPNWLIPEAGMLFYS